MIYAAVAGLSASSLAFELLVTRWFSIAHWGNLAFLAIGVAMFGFAAGGTFHCMARRPLERAGRGAFPQLCVAEALAVIGAFLLVKWIPLDYMRLPVEAAQAAYILSVWLILALPFFFCGLASCAAYTLLPEHSGAVSCAAMLGGVSGVLTPILLIPLVGEGRAIIVAAVMPLLPVIATPRRPDPHPVPRGRASSPLMWRAAALLLVAALTAAAAWPAARPFGKSVSALFAVTPSPYKTLPQLMQAPGTVVTAAAADIRGRLEEVESPGLHSIPGLSLGFTGDTPRQRALVLDGDSTTTLYDLSDPGAGEFASWTHPFAAFDMVGTAENCLVIQENGGLAVACALASGAARVSCAAADPRIAEHVALHYEGIRAIPEPPRTFLARAAQGGAVFTAVPGRAAQGGAVFTAVPGRAAQKRFDVISVEAWGPSIPGMASLNEDGLLTVDSIRACWRLLTGEGVLAIPRRIVLPPSDTLRVFSACLAALRREGVSYPARHLAVISSWDSCTILASSAVIDGARLSRLEGFARSRGFDLDWSGGVPTRGTARFNVYATPIFGEAYRALVEEPAYATHYPLDIGPQGDDRPFPHHFTRWTHMRELAAAAGNMAYALFLSGDAIAAATLLAALAASLLLLVPVALTMRRRTRGGPGGRAEAPCAVGRLLFLATASGLGFMCVEMAVIDAVSLAFPAPGTGLAIALGGILASSAFGGLASQRLGGRFLHAALAAAGAGIAASAFLVPLGVGAALPLEGWARAAACLSLTVVPGFLVGIPFPAAMRLLGPAVDGPPAAPRAAAWALNGCASAVASILSALIAPAAGIRALFLLAACIYTAAVMVLLPSGVRRPPEPPGRARKPTLRGLGPHGRARKPTLRGLGPHGRARR